LNAFAPNLPTLTQIRAERARRAEDARRRHLQQDHDLVRARCRTLAGFVRQAWHVLEPSNDYVHGWHIDAICEHLEAITNGEITRLLINVPPGTMKSLLTGVFWPAWEWGPGGMPSLRYLGSSYSEDYAKRDNRRMRDLVSSEWYQALWGDQVQLVRAGETEFSNTATGFRKGVPFVRLTGGRGDRVIIDDPHSTEGAESEAERNTTTRIFTESVPTRLNSPERSAIIVIMQRLNERDVSGTILSRHLGYEHLCLPMEFEPERRCITSIGFEDPRTCDGEPLFPARFPPEVIARDKRVMGSFAWAGQAQQRPTAREGGLFKRAWFADRIVPAERVPHRLTRCRAWDFAGTAKKTGNNPDWTAGVRIGRSMEGDFFVEHVERFQGSPGTVEKTVKALASTDPISTTIRIPEDPGQAGKAQAETYVKALAGYDVKTVRPTGDKETRAKPSAVQCEAGNVYLVEGPWNEAFLDELCTFPGGANDDQVDAFADAVNELALGANGNLESVSTGPRDQHVPVTMWGRKTSMQGYAGRMGR
jgi:predicted phage terminase large subunit-like protein